jgi:hypothetical protein
VLNTSLWHTQAPIPLGGEHCEGQGARFEEARASTTDLSWRVLRLHHLDPFVRINRSLSGENRSRIAGTVVHGHTFTNDASHAAEGIREMLANGGRRAAEARQTEGPNPPDAQAGGGLQTEA